jgi:hypothetical protein
MKVILQVVTKHFKSYTQMILVQEKIQHSDNVVLIIRIKFSFNCRQYYRQL